MVKLSRKLDPSLTGYEAERLHSELQRMVVGQDEAVQQIVNIYQMYLAGMNSPGRPVGNFLFLGPTGTGKTRLVEATAECLVGDPKAVIKIDCSEFQHSHEIAKLIGSPPGYLGHRETHALLSQEVLKQHHTDKMHLSFVLFDEIEKASDALWNLLLGVLDKATLTMGDNRKVSFASSMIFMTSNLGAAEMGTLLHPKLGFGASEVERQRNEGTVDAGLDRRIASAGLEAARKKFTPEFMNRIDKTVVFKPLGSWELQRILNLELGLLQQRIFAGCGGAPFVFGLSVEAKEFLLREGTDLKYGARHLKRSIERSLVQPLSNLVASGQIGSGDFLKVEFDPEIGGLSFIKEAEEAAPFEMVAHAEKAFVAHAAAPAKVVRATTPRGVAARSQRGG
jgi:ATP-dependent Clp protease ATP-binding subunit ClpA